MTEYIIAVFELCEAELTSFKKGIFSFFIGIMLLFIVAIILLIAVVFLSMGTYDFYFSLMPNYFASFATASTFILLALSLIGFIKWRR